MRKSTSNLPIPTTSPPGKPMLRSLGRGHASQSRSAEDIRQKLIKSGESTPVRGRSPHPEAASTAVMHYGMRYITDDMIRRHSKEHDLASITNLNLTLSKEGGKKIKYIENLETLKRLQVLILSCNSIEKIEKLGKLTKLRELNLSFNSIQRIEGLETLTSLQVLNLTGNQIENIPVWLGKKLKALRVIKLAKNNLTSLNQLTKLKPLPDLVQLTLAENPLADLPHSRYYTVFHLRTLESLDGQPVASVERDMAKQRFEQDELKTVEHRLEQEESRYRQLEEDHNRSVHDLQLSAQQVEDQTKRDKHAQEAIKQLQQELETKDDLLRKKTSELTRACEKHYQLEQDLAFHKIDEKFDSLGKGPDRDYSVEDANMSQLEESPYIGRARFKANKYAHETSIGASPQQAKIHSLNGSPRASPRVHPDVREQLHQVLDNDLSDKQKAIEKAQGRLKKVQIDVELAEQKLGRTNKEIEQIEQLKHDDDGKNQLRLSLVKRIQSVKELQTVAAQVEDDMQDVQGIMSGDQIEISRLRSQLQAMKNGDPSYGDVYQKMCTKEQRISDSQQMIGQLHKQLEDMLGRIGDETADIKELEWQLNQDQISQNEDVRDDVAGIMAGLQRYMSGVRERTSDQQRDLTLLIEEKEELEEKLRSVHEEMDVMDGQSGESKELYKRIAELEESLLDQREENQSLQDHLHKSLQQEPEIQDRIELAEDEVKNLRQSLREAQRKAEADRQALEDELEAERSRLDSASKKVKTLTAKEDEMERLSKLLHEAKAANRELRQKMADQHSEFQGELNNSISPDELERRLLEMTEIIKSGEGPIRPEGISDRLGQSIREIQDHFNDKLAEYSRDVETSAANRSMVDVEMQEMD